MYVQFKKLLPNEREIQHDAVLPIASDVNRTLHPAQHFGQQHFLDLIEECRNFA